MQVEEQDIEAAKALLLEADRVSYAKMMMGQGSKVIDRLVNAFALHRIEATRTLEAQIGELREEVSYLLDRSSEAGRCRFGGKRWTGMSSNAINAVAFGRDDPGDMPFDSSDLAACYEMLKRLPKHLLTAAVQDRLILAEQRLLERYPEEIESAREYAEWPGYAALQHKEPKP